MTTAPPAAEATQVCRLTVDGPACRADLSVPVTTPVSALLPVLLGHVTTTPEQQGAPWVLQRLGDAPLDPEATPETAGLRHGDVLQLRPADAPLPALHFDDVSDGVAHSVSGGPGRWQPKLTRNLALALACLALAALAAALIGAGPGVPTAGASGLIALVLAAGCVGATRLRADRGSVLVAGIGAFAFTGLAGLTSRVGPDGGYTPGVLVAATGLVALAGVLLAFGALPLPAGSILATAVSVIAGAGLVEGAGLRPAQAAAVIAVALFVLGHIAPRVALRTARLRVPHLPHDAEELQEDIEPEQGDLVARRARIATAFLDMLAIASAIVWGVAAWLLAVHERDWAGWLLPLTLSMAVLLRARGMDGVLQRVPAVLVGAGGLGVVLVVRAAPAGRAAVLALLLAAAALLLVGAWRLPHGRLLPVWGHLGDLMEIVTALAVLPLLLQVLDGYAYFRGLAG
ncbi:type VII secretion integral membrane protein EccD [Streptomyces coerulescens]|uniref:Type VII secretion integral membrane protein EccD n=1 Tax=Streptomyces coerulescens TaxID=29304 RepID=A0ABW0CUU7_STRCD